MSDTPSTQDRLSLATRQFRKALRMTALMGALAAFSLLSHFVPVLGADTGIFPWWMTVLTVLLFGFTVLLSQNAKARRDEAAKERP